MRIYYGAPSVTWLISLTEWITSAECEQNAFCDMLKQEIEHTKTFCGCDPDKEKIHISFKEWAFCGENAFCNRLGTFCSCFFLYAIKSTFTPIQGCKLVTILQKSTFWIQNRSFVWSLDPMSFWNWVLGLGLNCQKLFFAENVTLHELHLCKCCEFGLLINTHLYLKTQHAPIILLSANE